MRIILKIFAAPFVVALTVSWALLLFVFCWAEMTAPDTLLISAITVISKIGVDMSVFPTFKRLCSWDGLVPQNNESAGKEKTTRITCAGAYIKLLLVQCALAVCMSDKYPEIKSRYLALKNAMGTRRRSLPFVECC